MTWIKREAFGQAVPGAVTLGGRRRGGENGGVLASHGLGQGGGDPCLLRGHAVGSTVTSGLEATTRDGYARASG